MHIPDALWSALDGLAFFTVPQTAQLLGCDERTVRRAIHKGPELGGFPSTRVGCQYRVPTWWLRQQVRPPGKAA